MDGAYVYQQVSYIAAANNYLSCGKILSCPFILRISAAFLYNNLIIAHNTHVGHREKNGAIVCGK